MFISSVSFFQQSYSGDFRVNEEGGPKVEFLTKTKWERSSHVLGGSGGMPPPGKIFGFQSIRNAI